MRARFAIPALVAALAATFTLALPAGASAAKFPLTLWKTGTGQGTVTSSPSGISCGTSCVEDEASFLDGTKVTLTASPKAGSYFAGWSGCDSEPSATKCEITVTEAEPAVEAEFNEIEKFFLTLEKIGTGQGTVTSSPAGINCGAGAGCEHEYLEGTKVTLTASPAAGSVFEGWTGCDSEPSATKCEVTVVEETTVEAEFNEIERVPLTLEKIGTGQGTVTSSPTGISCTAACPEAAAEYLEGTKVTLTASPAAGSVFDGWTGCDSEPSATKCEVTAVDSPTIQAEFNLAVKPKFKLTVTKSGTGSGTVTSTPSGINCGSGANCEAEFEEGVEVTLAQAAASGSEFKEWTGACTGSGACKVTINGAKAVGVKFDAQPSGGGGSGGGTGGGSGGSSTTPPPAAGTASAAARAMVTSGKAPLKVTCSGGPCSGTLQLAAKVTQGKKTKSLVIGNASFSLASGASTTLNVKLSGPAKQEMAKGKTIKAQVGGTGVAGSTVTLKAAKTQKRHTG